MTGVRLSFDVFLAAPPDRVFAALTEARHLERWFCDACDSDPRTGGLLRMRWARPSASPQAFEARWTVFDAPRAAAFRGGHDGYPDRDAGLVAFALESGADGTRLAIAHELPEDAAHAALADGFRAAWPRALARLTAYLTPIPERTTGVS